MSVSAAEREYDMTSLAARSRLRCASVLAGLALAAACSSSGAVASGQAPDGGAGGASGGSAGAAAGGGGASAGGKGGRSGTATGGAVSAVPPLQCGGATCSAVDTGVVESKPCCTAANACGVQLVLSTTCLPPKQPGGASPLCPAFDIAGKITMPGCCGPKGCGALATFGSLGCIPNADLGLAAAPCTPSRGVDSGAPAVVPRMDAGPDGASRP
jgi:hypothetical protein